MKPGRYIVLGVLVLAGTCVGIKRYRARHATALETMSSSGRASNVPYDETAYNTHAPANTRVTVEVINATKVRGLARKATMYLRDRGFDVVFVGTTREQRTETLVLDRSGHPAWAQLIAVAMHGRAESRPDTTRYVDATVLLGSDWAPPPVPFYP